MKKFFLTLTLCAIGCTLIASPEKPVKIRENTGAIHTSWSPFQLALYPGEYGQLFHGKANIYGIAIGIIAMEQQSTTISAGLTSGQDKNYGIIANGTSLTNENYGLAVSVAACFTGRNYGCQISAVNIEAYANKRREDLKDGFLGIQIGAVNVGQGFQIGVFNYNPDAAIPFLPIINFPKAK